MQASSAKTQAEGVVKDPKDQLWPVKTPEKYFNGLSWVEIYLLPIILGIICFLPYIAFTETAVSLVQLLPNGGSENSVTVFGRLGSLTTIGAIFIELWILNLVDTYQRGSKVRSTNNYISKKELGLLRLYKMAANIILVKGTFIWGFGDLLV